MPSRRTNSYTSPLSQHSHELRHCLAHGVVPSFLRCLRYSLVQVLHMRAQLFPMKKANFHMFVQSKMSINCLPTTGSSCPVRSTASTCGPKSVILQVHRNLSAWRKITKGANLRLPLQVTLTTSTIPARHRVERGRPHSHQSTQFLLLDFFWTRGTHDLFPHLLIFPKEVRGPFFLGDAILRMALVAHVRTPRKRNLARSWMSTLTKSTLGLRFF